MATAKTGGILKGKKHRDCDHDGCGIKLKAGQTHREAEAGEFLLAAKPLRQPGIITLTGTKRQIAEKINGSSGIIDGKQILHVDKGQYVINAKAMQDTDVFTVTGTRMQIASAINVDKGYGIEFALGATINSNKKNTKQDIMATKKSKPAKKTITKKLAKGGAVYKNWGTQPDFDALYEMFPDNHADAKAIWLNLSKAQQKAFVDYLDQGDAASEHLADSWLEFMKATDQDNYWEIATDWSEVGSTSLECKKMSEILQELVDSDIIDSENEFYDDATSALADDDSSKKCDELARILQELINNGIIDSENPFYNEITELLEEHGKLAKGGPIDTAPTKVEIYDEENYPSVRAYLKKVITDVLGAENQYSGSADWGGIPVWQVTGDKLEGTFVIIDDNNNVILMTRQLDSEQEEYIDNDIEESDPENETEFLKLLQKAHALKNKKMDNSKKYILITESGKKTKGLTKQDIIEIANNSYHELASDNPEEYGFDKAANVPTNNFDNDYPSAKEHLISLEYKVKVSAKKLANGGPVTEKLFLVTDNNPDQYRRSKPVERPESFIRKNWDLTTVNFDEDDDENFEEETLDQFLSGSERGMTWTDENDEYTIENIGTVQLAKGGPVTNTKVQAQIARLQGAIDSPSTSAENRIAMQAALDKLKESAPAKKPDAAPKKDATAEPSKQTRADWERQITDIIVEKLEVTNSDAQGMLEAFEKQTGMVTADWKKRRNPTATASKVMAGDVDTGNTKKPKSNLKPAQAAPTTTSGKTGDAQVKYVDKQIDAVIGKTIYFKGNKGSWIKGKINDIVPSSKTKEHWNIEFTPAGAGKEIDGPMVSDKLTTNQIDQFLHGDEVKKYTITKPDEEILKDFTAATAEIDICAEEAKAARVVKQRTAAPPVKKKPAEILNNKFSSLKAYATKRITKKDPKKVAALTKILERHEKELKDFFGKK